MRVLLFIAAALTAFVLSLLIGPAGLSLPEALQALLGSGDPAHILIMQELRLPRSVLALIIGAGLGASGAALQGYTRNPLAEPGILGFSACAALGAVLALYFGLRSFVPVFALIGAAIGAMCVLLLVGARKSITVLILAGVGIGAFSTAVTGLIMNFAPNPWALSEIIYWMMGSLQESGPKAVITCLPLTLLGLICLALTAVDLRTLALGEDTAISLGVSLRKVQFLLVIGVALCVGSGVAVAGAIGFVGLFVPHIIRLLGTSDPAKLIPLSALGGGAFLCVADVLTRVLTGPGTQLYLGILTSLIGVPFFLYLVIKEARS